VKVAQPQGWAYYLVAAPPGKEGGRLAAFFVREIDGGDGLAVCS